MWRTVAPVLVNCRPVGWVSGPQQPDETFFKFDQAALPVEVRELVKERKTHPIDLDKLKIRVRAVARRLASVCAAERRTRIIEETTKQLYQSTRPHDVIQALLRGVTLICTTKEVRFYENTGFRNKLVAGEGDHYSEETPELDEGTGHVGIAIKSRRILYEPRLEMDDHSFDQGSSQWRPISVFTVPVQWGPRSAAIQIQSGTSDAFSLRDRYAVELLAARAGNVATRLMEDDDRHLQLLRTSESKPWDQFLVATMLRKSTGPFDLLTARQSLYRRFNLELFARAGANCLGSSIRVLNPTTGILGYVDCEGREYTPELKDRTFTRANQDSFGWTALNQKDWVYEPNLERSPFARRLPSALSVLAWQFKVRGERRGVVTVTWDTVDGCTPEIRDRLKSAFDQFEPVLDALSAREEELFRELEIQFAGKTPVAEIGAQVCEHVREVFNARACSLFLDRNGVRHLTLVASTHPLHGTLGNDIYSFGEGITGWVAKHQRSVRLRNTSDDKELRNVETLYGIEDPIIRSEKYKEDIEHNDAVDRLSFLAAPLARDRVIGVIRLTIKSDLTEFTPEDETFLQEVADRLALAFDSLWRDEDATAKIRQMLESARLDAQVLQARDLQAICRVLADEIFHGTRAAGVYVKVIDSQSRVESLESAGIFKTLQAARIDLPVLPNHAKVSNIWNEQGWQEICAGIELAFDEGGRDLVKAGVLLPLALEVEHCQGSICIVWNDDDQSDAELRYQDFASRASHAIEQGIEQTRLRAHIVHLRDVGLKFNLESNLKELLSSVLKAASDEADMERGQVRLYDEERRVWKLIAYQNTQENVPPEIETTETLKRCLASGKPVVIEDTEKDQKWIEYLRELPPGALRDYLARPRSRIAIPLMVAERCLGVISLQSLHEPAKLTPDKLYYLEVLSQYASLATESAQTHQKELEVAEPFAYVGKMLSGFLHVMGNKLNNAWATFSNLSLPGLPEAKRSTYLVWLERDLTRLSEIHNDLRIGFDPDKEASRQRVDVNTVIERAWNDSQGPRSESLHLTKRFSLPSPVLLCNEMELEIAIRMLIQNALEAIGTSGKVLLATKATSQSIILRVADDGPGMDKETKKNCTRPFFTTKGATGKGLGLAVVLGIVTRQKGKLRISTKKGKGAVFSLVFPVKESGRG